MGQTQGLVVDKGGALWCALDCSTRIWAASLCLVLLYHKIFFLMPPNFFIHKFIEFPLCPLGHRCKCSERVHCRVGVRSAKRPEQACVLNARAKQMPGVVEVQRGEGLALWGSQVMFVTMVRGYWSWVGKGQ